MKIFVPITKVDAAKRLVYGTMAVEEPDKSGEIFDYATSKPLVEEWSGGIAKATDGKSYGNVRAMHGSVAAGRLDQIAFDDEGKRIEVVAKIVDDNEWTKVDEGVYTGFSIGGKYEKRWKDGDYTRYTARPSEVSIVDNPCVPGATFSMVKMDGATELRRFKETNMTVTNEQVAERAKILAKAAGDESKWASYVEAARGELEKAAPASVTDQATSAQAAPAQDAATPANPSADLAQVWQARDGKTFGKKADAIAHNEALAKADTPAEQLRAAIAGVDAGLKKAEDGLYGGASSAQPVKASEKFPTNGDLPANVLQVLPDADAQTVFREAVNDAAKEGKSDAEQADYAWGKVREGWTQTVDGTYAAANGLTADKMAKRDFSDKERSKLASSGKAMSDGSYPIENKSDLHNAIQAFGRAKNKKATKEHIKSRAKDLGASDALPDSWKDGATKDARASDLRKSMYDVGRLACLIEDLESLQQCVECEERYENDTQSTTAKDLKANIASLCATLKARVAEETDELMTNEEAIEFSDLMELSYRPHGLDVLAKIVGDKAPGWLAKVGKRHSAKDQGLLNKAYGCMKELGCTGMEKFDAADLAKKGSRHSAADMEHMNKAYDHLEAAGATDEKQEPVNGSETGAAAKAETTGDLAKVTLERDDLAKVVAEAIPLLKGFGDRLKRLEDQPAIRPEDLARLGAQPKFTVVGKSDDATALSDQVADMAKNDPDALATALFKAAQRDPKRMGPNGF